MEKQKFSFKVLSIGSFNQLLMDNTTILNRPCVTVDDKKIRYGNEYLLFDQSYENNIIGRTFLGSFSIDKKSNINLKLFRELDVPIQSDYYLLTFDHEGDRISKSLDLVKSEPNSNSKVFSCAYWEYEEGKFKCQTTLIVKHADILIVNNERRMFSAKQQAFI